MPNKKKPYQNSPDDLLRRYSPPVRRWAKRVRKLVRSVAPRAEERVYLGWRVMMYCRGRNMFSYIGPLKNGVNLGFARATRLPDPHRLLEGTGKNMRHVKIRADKDIHPGRFRQLIRAAYRLAAR